MSNTPLSASEQSKVLIFTLLMVPAILALGAGVLPALLLGFGLFMMRKQQDFSHLETAVRNVSYLLYFFCAVSLFFALTQVLEYLSSNPGSYSRKSAVGGFLSCLIITGILLAYVAAVKLLLLKPLQAHSRWVVSNGIFSSKVKVVPIPTAPNLDIIQGEKLRSYSVADELLKWARLKEEGHISEEEYNEARKKTA